MAVLNMRKIVICAIKENRKNILELLQRKGCLEIEEKLLHSGKKKNPEDQELLSKMNTATQISIFDKNAALSEHALEILQEYCPEKTSMLSSLEGRREIDSESYYAVAGRQQELMNQVSEMISLKKQIDEKNADIVKLQ